MARLAMIGVVVALAIVVGLVSCVVPKDIADVGVQAVKLTLTQILGQQVAAGDLSTEAFRVVTGAIDEASKVATAKMSNTPYEFDWDRAVDLGGVALSTLLGTTALSRMRRGVAVFTGRSKEFKA